MNIDTSYLNIAVTLIVGAIVLSLFAWQFGRKRSNAQNDGDECEKLKDEFREFEKVLANTLFGPRITADDIALILYDMTGASVDDLTTSKAKYAQAIALIAELKRRGMLLQVWVALYKRRPDLITNP